MPKQMSDEDFESRGKSAIDKMQNIFADHEFTEEDGIAVSMAYMIRASLLQKVSRKAIVDAVKGALDGLPEDAFCE